MFRKHTKAALLSSKTKFKQPDEQRRTVFLHSLFANYMSLALGMLERVAHRMAQVALLWELLRLRLAKTISTSAQTEMLGNDMSREDDNFRFTLVSRIGSLLVLRTIQDRFSGRLTPAQLKKSSFIHKSHFSGFWDEFFYDFPKEAKAWWFQGGLIQKEANSSPPYVGARVTDALPLPLLYEGLTVFRRVSPLSPGHAVCLYKAGLPSKPLGTESDRHWELRTIPEQKMRQRLLSTEEYAMEMVSQKDAPAFEAFTKRTDPEAREILGSLVVFEIGHTGPG